MQVAGSILCHSSSSALDKLHILIWPVRYGMIACGIVTVTKYGRIPGGRRDWRYEAVTGVLLDILVQASAMPTPQSAFSSGF
jgi:hypothetical protein